MTKTKSQKQRAKMAQGKQPKAKSGNSNGNAPLSKASKQARAPKREVQNKDGSRTIFFEEYVQDMAGAVSFTPLAFPVQPGVATLFAWLSTQAIAYQEYEVEEIAFRFESERDATASGKVMLAFQPDPSDALPASKQEMLENEFKAKCKTWEDVKLSIPRAYLKKMALQRTRFIRSGVPAADQDLKLFDIGQLIVAVNGQANTTDIGELYVEYGIRLMTPVINAGALAAASSSTVTGAGSVTRAAPFGTAPTFAGGLDLSGTGATLTFNRVGKFLCTFTLTGTGFSTSMNPGVSGGSATSTVTGGIGNAAANAGTTAIFSVTVIVTARKQTLVLDLTGSSTTVTALTAVVAQWATS